MRNNFFKNRKNQQGLTMAILLAAIIILGILAYIGSTVYTSIVNGNQRANLTIMSSQSLQQAAFTLTSETTRNGSGIPVASAFVSGTTVPTNGGIIPNTSAAPKIDAWGTNIGYCVKAASSQSDPVFAVISAGPNKTFNTTCDQAFANNLIGDDKAIIKTVSNILQGVGGTVYYGDPVATQAELGNLAAVTPGQIRVVTSEGTPWINRTGAAGLSNWEMLIANSSSAISIYNIGDPCYMLTKNSKAIEGIGITPDRQKILTCQNNAWTPQAENYSNDPPPISTPNPQS